MVLHIRVSILLIFLLLLMFSCESLNDAVNAEPDTKYYNGEYEVDVNEDGLLDLKMDVRFFVFGDRNLTSFYIKPLNGIQFYCEADQKPYIFSKYDTINFYPVSRIFGTTKQ